MQYKNPLILRFDRICNYSPEIQDQLTTTVNTFLLADSGRNGRIEGRSILAIRGEGFVLAIRRVKHYRVLHIYDKDRRNVIIGISTEVEQ